MASTQDCKTLLDTDMMVAAAGGKGPWKRLSKKNESPEKCVRTFSNKEGTCFVRVCEHLQQGTLSVTHVADTLEALTTAAQTPQGAVHGGRLCWNVNQDEEAARKAELALQTICEGNVPDEGFMHEYGVAVANRMLFAILGSFGDYDDDLVMEHPLSEADEGKATRVGGLIVPDLYWNREEGYVADFPLYLNEYLEQFNAESPNDTSDWVLEARGVKEAVWALLDLGFTWDRDLQVRYADTYNAPWILEWMDQGAPGRPSVSSKNTL